VFGEECDEMDGRREVLMMGREDRKKLWRLR